MSKWIVLLVLLCSCNCSSVHAPRASHGLLDLRGWDFAKNGAIALNGEWEFYWNSLLETPEEIAAISAKDGKEFILVPGSWATSAIKRNAEHLPIRGYATYRLMILVDPGLENLALMTGQMGTACSVSVNGKLLVQAGRVGRSSSESFPAYQPAIAFIPNSSEKKEVIVRCSNFHHSGKSGFWSAIEIGRTDDINRKWESLVQMDWFSMGSLLIMGLYHLGLFSLRRKDRSALWFAIFCILISLRALSVGTYYLARTFPIEYFWIPAKLDFLSFYIATPVMVVFLGKIFPEEVKGLWVKSICAIGAVASIFTLATPQYYYTQTLLPFELVIVVYGVYAIVSIVRAAKGRRQGAVIFLAGFGIFFALIVNDILAQQLVLQNREVAGFGLFVFVLSQAFLLSQRYADAFGKVEHLSQELLRQEQMATVGNMAAGIVHDLKNPTGIIKGCAEMANDDSIGRKERAELLVMIDEEADRMLGLVQDLLDYSRGAVSIQKRQVDVVQYLDRITKVLERKFMEKRIRFTASTDMNGTIVLDPDRFLRVLVNIGGNAADAMDENGSFELQIQSKNNHVVFSLIDDGPGIPEEIQSTIFEPFVTHGKASGTGLGMAISRTLVIAHGGTISFKTEAGKGTEFTIALPVDSMKG